MLGENIKLAFASIAANKLRSFLTMLGIIIGIAAVIAIMTVGNSQTEQVREQYASFGTNNVDVYMWLADEINMDDLNDSENGDNSKYIPNFTEDMMNNMLLTYGDRIDAVSVTSWMSGGGKAVRTGTPDSEEKYANVSLQGVNPGYFTVNDAEAPIQAGRIFQKNELGSDSYVCIVSDKLVNNLFDGDVNKALGQKITFPVSMDEDGNETTADYTIIGVYTMNMSYYGFDGGVNSEKDVYTTVYIPYLNSLSYAKGAGSRALNNFTLKVKTGEDVISFSDELQSYLTGLLGDNSNFQVYVSNNKQWIEEADASMKQQVMTITLIGAIALLVGGIGVMNIMTVSITERTREIGTRKALGAPNRDIRMQFITEAVIICIIGGLIGIAAGIGIGAIACKAVQHIPMVMSWKSVLGSFGVSLAIGVFFGYYPANKAAKMDPIEALRYE